MFKFFPENEIDLVYNFYKILIMFSIRFIKMNGIDKKKGAKLAPFKLSLNMNH